LRNTQARRALCEAPGRRDLETVDPDHALVELKQQVALRAIARVGVGRLGAKAWQIVDSGFPARIKVEPLGRPKLPNAREELRRQTGIVVFGGRLGGRAILRALVSVLHVRASVLVSQTTVDAPLSVREVLCRQPLARTMGAW